MKKKLWIYHLVIGMLVLSACGGNPATAQPSAAATQAPAEAEQAPASEFFLQITNIKGLVEVRKNADEAYAPAEVGQKLSEGAQIRTGEDGIIALYRDAITMVIIDHGSEAQIKTLSGSVEVPVTVISLLSGAAALEHHAEKLPEGSIFRIETPEGNNGDILGSTVRVQYNAETKVMTATCLTGTCEFVRGDQKLTLEAGQAVDVTGLQPPPGSPEEMTTDQANQFLAMGGQLCGCQITIGEIRDGGLSQTSPAPEEMSGEQNGESTVEPAATEPAATEPAATEPSTDGGDSGGDSGGGDSGGDSGGEG